MPDRGNYPYIKTDVNGRDIQDSSDDLAFRGDYNGGQNLVYSAFARPGASEDDLVWQIAFHVYDGNDNITSTTWPEDDSGHASSEYNFSYTDRTSYTYS